MVLGVLVLWLKPSLKNLKKKMVLLRINGLPQYPKTIIPQNLNLITTNLYLNL